MTSTSRMDRHLFASSDSRFDTAWETVARSEGLPAARAGRLEERVPWAAELADRERPPVLVGGEVDRSPLGALPMAFLPMDGRLGLSVSGVVAGRGSLGGTPDRERALRPRIATHTLLFDEEAFRRCAGFPLGLFSTGASGVSPRGWFASFRAGPLADGTTLPAVSLSADPRVASRFERARVAAVRTLGGRVVEALGVERAISFLAEAYRSLTDRGREGATVVGRDRCAPSVASELVLLTWLSLPLEDRMRVFWSTEPGTRALAPLLVPWAAAGPTEADVAAADDPRGPLAAWARLALVGQGYDWAAKRLDVRRASLLDGSFQGPDAFQDPHPPLGDLTRWVEAELAGASRLRGLGAYLARYIGRAGDGDRPGAVRLALEIGREPGRKRFHEALVRAASRGVVTLERSDDEARLAIRAGLSLEGSPEGLSTAVAGLDQLIRSGGGMAELREVVASVALDGGEDSAGEMWRIGLDLLRRWDRIDEVPAYLELLRSVGCRGGEIAGDVAVALAADRAPASDWRPALSRLWQQVIHGVPPAHEGLHRLAWAEHRRLGETSLAVLLAAGSDRAATDFTTSFMAADPALPVYLELRRALLRDGGEATVTDRASAPKLARAGGML